MAAGDDTLGGQDLAVSNGQARTFRFVRAGGFSGTWTAVAGPTLTFDLTVTTDGADRLVVIPAANEALLGKPWRFRRNGVDKVGGTIQVLRPTDPAGDGTVTFTDADAVTITCSVVGGDNAGEIAVTEGVPPLWDPDTVEARFALVATGFGLDPASPDVAAIGGVLFSSIVIDDDNTVEGRLNNAETLDVWTLVGDVLRDRQITAAAAHVHQPPTEAHLLVGATTGPYTERRWISDFEHDFTTDTVIQFEIDAELIDVQGNPDDAETMYPEWLTRTGDNGAGAIDDVEISPETSTVTGRSLLFLEGTPDGYATEIGTVKAPMSGRARWIVEIAQETGVWRILREAQGGSETYRGRFYLEVGRKEWGEATQMVAHGTDPYWYIGRSLGTSRIFHCEVFEDGVGVFGPDIASAVDGDTAVDDLHKVAGQWDADGSAEVVVPATSGSGPDLSDATPAALGVAAAGVSADASRADHVHQHAYGSLVVPLFVPSSSNGTWAPAGALDYIQNGSPVDGHWVQWLNVPLGGTYTIGCAVQQTNASGKFQVSIDGSDVGSLLDAYAAGNTPAVLTSTGVVIAPGLHTVRITLNGKHASSSGYQLRLASVAFTRTA